MCKEKWSDKTIWHSQPSRLAQFHTPLAYNVAVSLQRALVQKLCVGIPIECWASIEQHLMPHCLATVSLEKLLVLTSVGVLCEQLFWLLRSSKVCLPTSAGSSTILLSERSIDYLVQILWSIVRCGSVLVDYHMRWNVYLQPSPCLIILNFLLILYQLEVHMPHSTTWTNTSDGTTLLSRFVSLE